MWYRNPAAPVMDKASYPYIIRAQQGVLLSIDCKRDGERAHQLSLMRKAEGWQMQPK